MKLSTASPRGCKETAERYGPESILPYSYAGTMGVLGYGSMDRRFFHRLGASQLDRTICSEAGGVAWNLVYGKKLGTPTEDFRLAKLVLAWGANIHGNNIHLWPFDRAGAAQRRAADCDRSLSHPHRRAGRLAYRHPARHRRGAGAGHDARDFERRPGRPRLYCRDDAWLRPVGRARAGVHAGARGRLDRNDARRKWSDWRANTPPRGLRRCA